MIYSPIYDICKPLYPSLTRFMKGGKSSFISLPEIIYLVISYNLFCKRVPLRTPLFDSNTSLLKWNYLASILGLTGILTFECLFTYSIWRKFWGFCYPSNFKKNLMKFWFKGKGEKWETIKNIYLTPYLIPVW